MAIVDFLLNETTAATVLRRAITIPAFVVLFALLIATSPITLPLFVALDLARASLSGNVGTGRGLPAVRALCFVIVYVGSELLGVAAAGLIWLSKTTARRDVVWYRQRNFRLQCWWCGLLVGAGTRLFRLRLRCEGLESCQRGPFLLFLRHTSLVDTPLACHLISRPYGIVLRYVLKRRLLLDPCLDLVGNRLINRFSRHGTDDSAAEIRAVAALAENLGPQEGVLIYPEGTRFSPQKRRLVLESLARRGDERRRQRAAALRHVLLPRPGGPLALLERNQSSSRADIVFCAHAGLEGSSSFRQLFNGALLGGTVAVRFWRVPAADLPQGTEALEDWLHEQWSRVDDAIEEFRQAAL